MRIEEKITGGKMVCIDLELVEGRISSIKITGDFFLHPEDTIDIIENALVGVGVADGIADIVSEVLSTNKAKLIGVSPEDIERMIKKAGG